MKYEQKITLKNGKEVIIRHRMALLPMRYLISRMLRPTICERTPMKTVLIRNRKPSF